MPSAHTWKRLNREHFLIRAAKDSARQKRKNTENRKAIRRLRGAPEALRPAPATCECCGTPAQKICLDHDHETGAFRGWLCNNCNVGIGALGDHLAGVLLAVRYLQAYKAAQ